MTAIGIGALILVAFAAAIAVLVLRGSPSGGVGVWPFYVKKPLSVPEQILYHRLVSTMPECMVLAQVQLSRVLGVKSGFNFHQWNNRINRMSLDFVVCLKDSTVVAAIELDDTSHEGPRRIDADTKKEKALTDAGVALIRWNVKALPDEAEIRKVLAK